MRARLDVERLYAVLEMARCYRGLSWRELGVELGVAPSAFSRMARGGRPDADLLCGIIRWLGLPLDKFIAKPLEEKS